jgi:hypothetical protein
MLAGTLVSNGCESEKFEGLRGEEPSVVRGAEDAKWNAEVVMRVRKEVGLNKWKLLSQALRLEG